MDANPYQAPDAPLPTRSPPSRASRRATLSLILGAVAIPVYCVPPVCLGLAVASIILGVLGWRSPRWPLALLGIASSCVALVLTVFLLMFMSSFWLSGHW